jgi:hypothetical protein
MGTKLKILSILFVLLFSCKSNTIYSDRTYKRNTLEGNIKFFKMQVYCACLRNAYENKDIMREMWKEDLLATFDGLASEQTQKTVDSLGSLIARTIKPEENPDFEGKKRITVKCLEYYTSKELDNIARKRFKKYY